MLCNPLLLKGKRTAVEKENVSITAELLDKADASLARLVQRPEHCLYHFYQILSTVVL